MRRRRVLSSICTGLITGAFLLASAGPAAADGPRRGHVDVLLQGLSSPKAIAIASRTSVAVGQGAYGPPGPALEYFYKGPLRGTSRTITDPTNLIDIAMTPDGAGWAIGGNRVLYRQVPGGPIQPVLDIAAYQVADPDPYNDPADTPADSNPFGLAALPSSDVLVADAAGNDVIRVSPNGKAVTVARWTRELVRTDLVGDPNLPKKLLAEAVPTSIAIGPDGWAYVGQLMGFPGRPGSAHIWRINPDAVGAVCTVEKRHRGCKVWKSGFTSIVDLAFNPRNGTLYVYEIAKKGWLAFEEGLKTGVFPPAVLLEVKGHERRELVKGKLSQPGGVAVARDGTIFVTDGMFGNGRLLRVRASESSG